jgi:hypothetical protein
LDLLPPGAVDEEFLRCIAILLKTRSVKGIDYSGATTKINLALDSLPNFTCIPNIG